LNLKIRNNEFRYYNFKIEKQTAMNKISGIIIAFILLNISVLLAEIPYWQDVQAFAINKEYPRTAFMTYPDRTNALTGKYENSPFYILLNGKRMQVAGKT
jgi:beta-galactosidase